MLKIAHLITPESADRARLINEAENARQAELAKYEQERTAAKNLRLAAIPPRYLQHAPPPIPPDDWRTAGTGILLISGPTGTYKSTLAAAMAQQATAAESVMFTSIAQLIADIQAGYGSDKRESVAIVDRAIACGLLVLDDLGSERPTEDARTRIALIIDQRQAWLRPTVITTNLELRVIADVYGDRVASRIGGGTRHRLDGSDQRLAR